MEDRIKKKEERLERSSLKKGDGRIIHPHPLCAAPLCESDLKTFGLENEGVKRKDE